MSMEVIGLLCIALAAIWILYKLYLAYNSAGGTVMVAVYDAAIFPPILAVLGLYLTLRAFDINYSLWIYPAICIGIGVLVIIGIKVAEEIGDGPLK